MQTLGAIVVAVVLVLAVLIGIVVRRRSILQRFSAIIASDDLMSFIALRQRHAFLGKSSLSHQDIVFSCCWKGSTRILAHLVESGANLNIVDCNGASPFHWLLCVEGRQELIAMLVAAGVDVTRATKDGLTPLHLAAKFGDVRSARQFLSRGADPDARNNSGESPRDLAAKLGRGEVLKLFAEHDRT